MGAADKINCIINIFILFSVLNIAKSSKLGEVCSLGRNKNGTCKEMKNCGYAKKLFAQRSEIQKCEFNGRIPVVCCPTSASSQNVNPSSCKADKVYNDTRNERPANVGEFPYFAALGYNTTDKKTPIHYRCAGALITNDIVLAPAHCVSRRRELPVTIKLGKVSSRGKTN